MLPTGTVLVGRYKLLDKLGEGGAAIVYRAQDLRLGRIAAVKVLRPEFVGNAEQVTRFENEARAAAALTAPNVVDVYDYGQDAGTLFIAMQYIDGEDLKHHIVARGRLTAQEAARIAADVCRGLEAAHEKGLIHRDVKPQNILIDRHGQVRLSDFGIAKALGGAGLTQSGLTYGTAAYLSPEQATGGVVGPYSDVYALGNVLYEMLCGHPPFEAENVAAIAYKQVYEAPPPLTACTPDVPPRLEAIVIRALAKDPAVRYATAADMAADLHGFLMTADSHEAMPAGVPAVPVPSGVSAVPVAPASSVAFVPASMAPNQGPAAPAAPAPLPVAASPPFETTAAIPTASSQPAATSYQTWNGAQAAQQAAPRRGGLLWLLIPALLLLVLGGLAGSGYLFGRAPGGRGATPGPPTGVAGSSLTPPPPTQMAGGGEPTAVVGGGGGGVTPTAVTGGTEPTAVVGGGEPTEAPPPTPRPPAAPTDTAVVITEPAFPTPRPPVPPTDTVVVINVPVDTPVPPRPTSRPPTAPPAPSGTKGRPIFTPPTPPTGTDRRVALEDLAFVGGYRYAPPSVYEGRTAVWMYGQSSGFASMSAPFLLATQPTGTATLVLSGMDSEDARKTPMRILVNGQTVFNGPNPLPNDHSPNAGNWGTATWTFPASVLHPGENTLTVDNLAPSAALGIPFIMVDAAQLSWEGEQ
ncbi:MAG TPA: protein kinase [Chloroflexia bacterium]|nr:protein kinase [Chloroflexia bacterium]